MGLLSCNYPTPPRRRGSSAFRARSLSGSGRRSLLWRRRSRWSCQAGWPTTVSAISISPKLPTTVVRRVSPSGILVTVAGTGTQGFAGDGGPATSALLDSPLAVALDSAANLYVADSHNHRIRRVDAVSGIITTLSGQFDLPTALAFYPAGNLCVAEGRSHLIQRIDQASGTITIVAGSGSQGFLGDLGAATQAAIDSPYGIAFDAAGNLYFSDTHNNRLRRVDHATGIITSVAAAASLSLPRGLAMDAAGNLFIVDANNSAYPPR